MENFIRQLAQEHFEADRQAFINFIRLSFPLDGDEITDIYNDVWMDVIDNVRRGRTERVSNWKSYVFNLGWKRACKRVTRHMEPAALDETEGGILEYQAYCIREAESDAGHMDHLMKIERLLDELEKMPAKHREVLELYYFGNMTTAEIAKAMDYSGARSVITIKRRSLSILQERMRAVA